MTELELAAVIAVSARAVDAEQMSEKFVVLADRHCVDSVGNDYVVVVPRHKRLCCVQNYDKNTESHKRRFAKVSLISTN